MQILPSIPSTPPRTNRFAFVAPPTVKTTGELLDGNRHLRDAYRRLEVEIAAGSRIWRAMRVEESLHTATRIEDVIAATSNADALVTAKDHLQLSLIAKHLLRDGCDPALAQKAKLLLRDRCMPENSGQNTPGRDTQFELYFAACCLRSGFDATLVQTGVLRSPDVHVVIGSELLQIEARRPKREARLLKCARDAANKFREAGSRGILAVDMSEIVRAPTNFSASSCAHQAIRMNAILAREVGQLGDQLEKRGASPSLLAVLGYWLNITRAADVPTLSAPEGWQGRMLDPVSASSAEALRTLCWGLGPLAARQQSNPPAVAVEAPKTAH